MLLSDEGDTCQRSVHVDGSRLKAIRVQLGMTQEAVAKEVGYTDRLIRKLERGGPVSRQTLADFIAFYEVIFGRVGLPSLDSTICLSTLIVQPHANREAIARDWLDQAYNQRNLTVIDDVFHPDVTLVAEGQTLHGRDAIRKRVNVVLAGFDPIRIEVENLFSKENTVIAYWHVVKTHIGPFLGIKPTGRTVSIRGNSMAAFKGDKIIEVRDHWDVQDLIGKLA